MVKICHQFFFSVGNWLLLHALGAFTLHNQQQCAVLACCSNKMIIDDKYGLCNLNAK
jgi:hypothetical protein